MARIARIVVPEVAYHVTHRGNRKQNVFYSDKDRARYLTFLAEYADRYDLDILAWCLMSNHVHLVCVPGRAESLARGVGLAHMRHARHVNARRGWTGHLWASRYFSCPLSGAHLWPAIKYVERNPVRARMVRRAENYGWSSAREHVGRDGPADADGDALLKLKSIAPSRRPFGPEPGDWRSWLGEEIDDGRAAALREHTRTGRPWGDTRFIDRLEAETGRSMRPKKRGPRPRKAGV